MKVTDVDTTVSQILYMSVNRGGISGIYTILSRHGYKRYVFVIEFTKVLIFKITVQKYLY